MNRRRLIEAGTSLGLSLTAVLVAIGACLVVIALVGKPPAESANALWEGAFGGRQEIAGTLEKAVPLTLVALGWIVAFTAYRINIGFEGQIIVGGICAAVVGLEVHGLAHPLHLPLAVAAGVVGGAVYAGIAAWLWAKRGVNEIISTLLLNFVAIQLLSWLIRGPLQEPEHASAESGPLAASARWPVMLSHTPLGWDALLIPAATAAVWFLLARTVFGVRLKLTGANERAARYAGMKTVRVGAYALIFSGAMAGLAGSSLILSGESGTLSENFSASYGFDGIVVALLARNSPIGVVPAALLLAALRQGGAQVEAEVGVSSALVQIIQGVVIVLIAGTALAAQGQRRRRAAPVSVASETTV